MARHVDEESSHRVRCKRSTLHDRVKGKHTKKAGTHSKAYDM